MSTSRADSGLAIVEVLNSRNRGCRQSLFAGRHAIGSNERAAVRLDDRLISGFAAILHVTPAGAALSLRDPSPVTDTPANPVLRNGVPVKGTVTLEPNDIVSIGSTDLRVLHVGNSDASETVSEDTAENMCEPLSKAVKQLDNVREKLNAARVMYMNHTARTRAHARADLEMAMATARRSVVSVRTDIQLSASNVVCWARTLVEGLPKRIVTVRLTRIDPAGAELRSQAAGVTGRISRARPIVKAVASVRLARNLLASVKAPVTAVVKRPAMHAAVAATVAVILVTAVTLSTFDEVSATAADSPHPAGNARLVESQLAEHAFSQVRVDRATAGVVVLSGFVDHTEQRRRIQSLFQSQGLSVDVRKLRIGAEIENSVNEVFAQLGHPQLSASFARSGVLRVNGYVTSRTQWNKLLAVLNRDFPGVERIDSSNIGFFAARLKVLRDGIAAKGLDGRLNVAGEENEIFVDGQLTQTEMRRWREAKSAFVAEFATSPRLIDETLLKPPTQPPEVVITGAVVSARKSFVVTADGNIFRPGEALADGSVVERIGMKKVTVRKGGDQFVLQVRVKG